MYANEALPNVWWLPSNHKIKNVGHKNINIYFRINIPNILIKIFMKTDTIWDF
jgi:hypothetical protein